MITGQSAIYKSAETGGQWPAGYKNNTNKDTCMTDDKEFKITEVQTSNGMMFISSFMKNQSICQKVITEE
jgi:hypothetical protein